MTNEYEVCVNESADSNKKRKSILLNKTGYHQLLDVARGV